MVRRAGFSWAAGLAGLLLLACSTPSLALHRGGLSIAGTPPASVTVGQSYAFTPQVAITYQVHTLVFAIANKPAWASFSSTTGTLTGTPTSANVGNYSNIVISAGDGRHDYATLGSFTIQVLASNSAPPVISGNPPPSVNAGNAYTFTPTATDPAGLPISFSVQNKPTWASFSIASGQLGGTPTTSQAGVYPNVVISASDGQKSAALPAFSITVQNTTVTGSAVLGITAPTVNTDGTPLTDLAGFRIYYGSAPGSLTQTVNLADPTVTSYTVSNLASGTWYFGATAYATDGAESALSSIGSKTIP
jgi:hypothetical protein